MPVLFWVNFDIVEHGVILCGYELLRNRIPLQGHQKPKLRVLQYSCDHFGREHLYCVRLLKAVL